MARKLRSRFSLTIHADLRRVQAARVRHNGVLKPYGFV